MTIIVIKLGMTVYVNRKWQASNPGNKHTPAFTQWIIQFAMYKKHTMLGDCESRNAGTRNGTWNLSTKVKFSVRGAPRFNRFWKAQTCAHLCMWVAEASDSCHEGNIYLTQVNQENDHTSMVPINPRSYANGGGDRSCENTVCGDAMTSYLCSPSLDSRPFQVYARIARSWVRLGPSLVYPVRG